jgi:hypothetical protein
MAAVLSVLLAVFVPLIRAQSPAFRRSLAWGIVIATVLATAGSLILCLRRWWIENRGGKLLLRPGRLTFCRGYLPWLIMVAAVALIPVVISVLMMPVMKDMARPEQGLGWTAFGIVTSIGVFAPPMSGLAYVIILLWWQVTPMTLEMRENGVGIGGLKFFSWSAITDCEWMDGKYATILTLRCRSRKHVALMPVDAREPVQRLLEAKGIKP